jgi:hypothetical protein
MALPSNVSYGTVNGRFILAYGDSDDSGLEPDAVPAAGSVFFTASPILLKNQTASPDPVTILPATVEVVLDEEGYLRAYDGVAGRGVRLVATDDPDNNPVDWTWRVDFRLTDQAGTPVPVPSFSFSLPSNSEVDLTDLSPVPSANGTFYLVGPVGPQGPRGEGLNIVGIVPTEDDLPTTGNTENDAYITEDNGHLWIWTNDSFWFDAGEFRGPGVAAGGDEGDILVKLSSTDYDTAWTNTIDGGSA